MTPPRVLEFRVVKKIFASYGIQSVRAGSAGHRHKRHWLLLGPGGVRYPIPSHGENEDVFRTYIEAARRAFRLTPEQGVSRKPEVIASPGGDEQEAVRHQLPEIGRAKETSGDPAVPFFNHCPNAPLLETLSAPDEGEKVFLCLSNLQRIDVGSRQQSPQLPIPNDLYYRRRQQNQGESWPVRIGLSGPARIEVLEQNRGAEQEAHRTHGSGARQNGPEFPEDQSSGRHEEDGPAKDDREKVCDRA